MALNRGGNAKLGRTIDVVVTHGVDAKNLHELLDRVIGLYGCPSCGFQGIDDFTIRVVNPMLTEKLGKIEGVQAISAGM
jgi:hypothetical protein